MYNNNMIMVIIDHLVEFQMFIRFFCLVLFFICLFVCVFCYKVCCQLMFQGEAGKKIKIKSIPLFSFYKSSREYVIIARNSPEFCIYCKEPPCCVIRKMSAQKS